MAASYVTGHRTPLMRRRCGFLFLPERQVIVVQHGPHIISTTSVTVASHMEESMAVTSSGVTSVPATTCT